MLTVMEADVNTDEFRLLLEDKINPIQKDIQRLEKNSLDILEILKIQVRQDETIQNIQKELSQNVIIHDEIFNRLREINTSCNGYTSIVPRLNTLEEQVKNSNNYIWDIVKLLVAGVIGYLIHWRSLK